MGQYQGMRWFKADFQVQTPEDSKHWSDTDLRLGNPRRPKVGGVPDESEISGRAQAFLRRCHELELQIIGITDHNFSGQTDPRDWFLTHLIEQNKSVATELGREMIHILPGFEVDIGYHVLCLFEPARKSIDLERVNKVLIQLGLPESQRFDRGMPTPLRREDSPISLAKLLKIVQDDNGGIVIAAHADQEDGLLQRPNNRPDYQLPDLLALEVTQYPLGPKISDILTGKNRDWARSGTRHRGVEAGLNGVLPASHSIGGDLAYRLAWTFSDFTFRGGEYQGNRIAGVPRQLLSAEVLYRLGPWSVGPNLRWMPQDTPTDHANTHDNYQDAYALWGFKVDYKASEELSLYVQGDNLTDEVYASSFVIRNRADASQPTFLSGNSRSINFGMNYRF